MEKDADDRGHTLFSAEADGSSAALRPFGPPGHFHPHGWTADGELVATQVIEGGVEMDLVRFAADADAMVHAIAAGAGRQGNSASVSPDGRWVAFTSEATGRSEVWVQASSGAGTAIRVSSQGGADPVWSRHGRELYYRENAKVMVVAVDTRDGFDYKVPVTLFSTDAITGGDNGYEATPDGSFLAFAAEEAPDYPLSVVVNWGELLRDRSNTH